MASKGELSLPWNLLQEWCTYSSLFINIILLSFIQHILTLDYYFLLMCILFSFIILLSSLFYLLVHLCQNLECLKWHRNPSNELKCENYNAFIHSSFLLGPPKKQTSGRLKRQQSSMDFSFSLSSSLFIIVSVVKVIMMVHGIIIFFSFFCQALRCFAWL